ncbi:MAG: hypothetical protein V1863_01245 [Candidatus Omnitrophota bacterium]
MFRWLNSKKGQNTAEYAILIGVIVAAAIAMQIYLRRGMQARMKGAIDYTMTADEDAGVGVEIFNQSQYEPYYLQTNFETTQSGQVAEMHQPGGSIARESIQDVTQRTGNQVYTNYEAANI